MPHSRRIKRITFELWDWGNGFFISFQVPWSLHNYYRIVAMPDSRNIKIH